MKKLLLTLVVTFLFACSTEEENKNVCCDLDQTELNDYVKFMSAQYEEWLANPQLEGRQREILEDQYQEFKENPCDEYIRDLESSGASCENPY